MNTKNSHPITISEYIFIILWGFIIVIIFNILGNYSIKTIKQYRETAIMRHNARIDIHAVEPGLTAAEADTLPATANPRRVTVGMYLDGIESISILESKWNPVFYIWFKWTGNDLHPGETFKIVDGEIQAREKLSEQVVNKERHAIYLVRASITKFFNTDRFPVDDHLLTIAIEDGSLPWIKLEYVADNVNSNISSRVKMPGYKVYRSGMVVKPHTYKTNFGDLSTNNGKHVTYSQLVYGVWNVRTGFGTYFKIFIGLFAAVSIAMLPFFIKPTNVDPRFGLGVGGFFGAVANTLIGTSLVPDNGSLTLMDMVNGIGMVTIFLILVQSTISLYLYEIRGRVGLSQWYDYVSFILIATSFTLINILIPLVGIVS